MKRILITCSLAVAASAAVASPFHLLVAETPIGQVGPSQWGGIRRYNFTATGSTAVQGTGIAASQLNDPYGLAFGANGELYVGNRHGNTAPSSISRFTYNFGSGTYTANGSVTGNSLFGVHGIGLSSAGEIFAANVNGPISRFSQSGNVVSPAGTFGGGPNRDAFVSANNQWVYVTQGTSNSLLRYFRPTGTLISQFSVPDAAGLHSGAWRGNDLYVAGFGSGSVHRISFDANGEVVSSSVVALAPTAISVAFSPDQNEMFVAGHTTGIISRFLFSNGSWVANGAIETGVNMGDIQVVPEPATLAALGLGTLVALLRKRK